MDEQSKAVADKYAETLMAAKFHELESWRWISSRSGARPHLPGCSYAPDTDEREAFIREHAVEIVRDLEEKVRVQATELTKNMHTIRTLKRDLKAAQERADKLQSSLLEHI